MNTTLRLTSTVLMILLLSLDSLASTDGMRWNRSWNAETLKLEDAATDRCADWMADLPDNMFVSHVSIPGAHDFARYLRSKGILAAITHTEAEFEDIKEAYAAGFTHAAQFYNAMPGFHKRREYKYEGTVESVFLMDDMTVEVIADGKHLPSTILRLVYKLKGVERTCLVTDALSYAASDVKPDEGSRIIIEDGVCKLADHSSLAGSIATMDVLVRTMVQKANIPLADAVRMASETPARLMGVSDRTGTLQRGKDADIIILDRNLTVRAVWSMGNLVPAANTLF